MENLGKKAKDKVTGICGIIVGKAEYLFGCAQYGVATQVTKTNDSSKTFWFDEGRLLISKDIKIKAEDVRAKRKGGINMDAPSL